MIVSDAPAGLEDGLELADVTLETKALGHFPRA
jgi:hypothetical protein